jgi:hypothetical protein
MDLSCAAGDLSGLMHELDDHAPAAKLLKHAIGRDVMPAIDALLAGQRYFDSSPAP